MLVFCVCSKMHVADKDVLFLRLSKFEQCEFTEVNDHFENERNVINDVFLLMLFMCKCAIRLSESVQWSGLAIADSETTEYNKSVLNFKREVVF